MGKKDITLNEFLGDPYIFADLLNGCCFHGRHEIRPEELLSMDTVQNTESRSGKPGKRIRDTKKLFYRERPAAVFAIENQERRDCRMPVRCMRYDADEYERQIKAVAAIHKEKTVTERGFAVIVNCTNSRRLQKYVRDNREGGCIDMCRAFDEWMDDCRKEGRADGIKIGEERGEKRGEKRGVKKGETRLAQLIKRLGEEERFTDILRVAENAALRNRLYRKYGL